MLLTAIIIQEPPDSVKVRLCGAIDAPEIQLFIAPKLIYPAGLYGDLTHQALMEAVADDDEGKNDEDEPDQPSVPEDEAPAFPKVVIISEGGKVNIRVGNGTNYGRISSVAPGTTFKYVATATNGWYAVEIGARIGWVSDKFSRII